MLSNNSPQPKNQAGQNNHNQKLQSGNSRPKGGKEPPVVPELYGVVVSLKESFGFVQPLMTDENIYFSIRDAPDDVKVGQEMSFVVKYSPRGALAADIKFVNNDKKQKKEAFFGTVIRGAEPIERRGAFGLIEITPASDATTSSPVKVPFLHEDICGHGRRLSGGGAPSRIIAGDSVKVNVFSIPGTSYIRASDVQLVQSKKDKLLAEQLSSLLEKGATSEQGHIESVRGDFGFIRGADRSEEDIYFRLEDVVDKDKISQLREGTDVEFLVLNETISGKLRPRAMNVKILPPGSVLLETTLIEAALGVVIDEPRQHPQEQPGLCRLLEPVETVENGVTKKVDLVEIWPRCCHASLVFRVGDIIRIDVTYYRPEKLYFARSVVVHSHRKLGREGGTICRIRDQGFGFLHSEIRNIDVYFRTAEVVGLSGEVLEEDKLPQDAFVSFDLISEESASRNSVGRLRAIRVRIESESGGVEGKDADAGGSSRTALMRRGVTGCVVREAKKDVPGLIRVTSDIKDLGEPEDDVRQDLAEAITEFQACAEWKEITLEHLSAAQRRAYHCLLDKQFVNIGHETVPLGQASGKEANKNVGLRLWKMTEAKFEEWRALRGGALSGNSKADVEDEDNAKDAGGEAAGGRETDNYCVSFLRTDVQEEVEKIVKDHVVTCDLYLDKRLGKRVARNIQLTEEEVVEGTSGERGCGVIDSSRSGKGGVIRCLQTDEKLSWSSGGKTVAGLTEGAEVSFEVRLRGGLRCAVDVTPVEVGSLRSETTLDGVCTAVVVDETHVVLLDVSGCAQLASKYLDLLGAAYSARIESSKTDKNWTRDVTVDAAITAAHATKKKGKVAEKKEESGEVAGPPDSGRSKAKYFPPLLRVPVAMDKSPEKAVIGSVVRCRAVADWALQRYPVRVTDIELDAAVTPIGKLSGVVLKVKQSPPGSVPLPAAVSLTEIEVLDGAEALVSQGLPRTFYCDSRDSSVARGEMVSFVGLFAAGAAVAVCVAVAPKPAGGPGAGVNIGKDGIDNTIVFKKVHLESKKTVVTPFKGTSMAKGPPDNESIGFTKGWREVPAAIGLPWGHLLAHLKA